MMMYSEIIAVCSQIHAKHTNTMYEQNLEFVNLKLVVHIVTTELWKANKKCEFLKIQPFFLLKISFPVLINLFVNEPQAEILDPSQNFFRTSVCTSSVSSQRQP